MRYLRTFVAALAVLAGQAAQADAAGALPASAFRWSFEPWVVAPLGAAVLCYALGLRRLRQEIGPERIIDRWQIAAFAAGMSVLFLALCSPIDAAADELFSAHMLQHILLMMLAPPLLVWSRPSIVFVWAFSPSWRKRIGRAWNGARADRLARFIMHPAVVFVLFCGSFVFWHLPRPYAWGLRSEFVHALEHLSFFLPALAFWTIILEPSGRRRLDYAATLLYLVVTVVLSDMPGALMVISPRLLYPIHAASTAQWGLTPMQDQELAGLIMWIPAGAIYLAAAVWLFVKLLEDSERRATRFRGGAAIPVLVLLLPLLLFGCRESSEASETAGGGNPHRGAALIAQFGCGTCHSVPGIDAAHGLVGPPLDHMGKRVYIAGVLRNTPDNMISWLRDPQAVIPGNAMPNMGIGPQQARDIAAYLDALD